MPDLTAEELHAIDFACMALLEMARRGRKRKEEYLTLDNDQEGADWMEAAIQMHDSARVTLRALLTKHKESK
jgi:hypothetical protein